jgi:hypothetical protein
MDRSFRDHGTARSGEGSEGGEGGRVSEERRQAAYDSIEFAIELLKCTHDNRQECSDIGTLEDLVNVLGVLKNAMYDMLAAMVIPDDPEGDRILDEFMKKAGDCREKRRNEGK